MSDTRVGGLAVWQASQPNVLSHYGVRTYVLDLVAAQGVTGVAVASSKRASGSEKRESSENYRGAHYRMYRSCGA